MFFKWLQQFAAHHEDPKITIKDFKGDKTSGEMILHVNTFTLFKYRQEFDMKVSALNVGY